MSKLSATSNTVKKLGITGIPAIGYKLLLFQQLNSRIITFIPEASGNGGKYYIEGDITDFISSYTYFWVNSRKCRDSDMFSIDSYSYDSDALWTEVTINSTSYDGTTDYSALKSDVGYSICGMYDATSLIKDMDNITEELVESGSLGNAVSSTFGFTINDESRDFYDKVNKSGYFYNKDILTEVDSVKSESEHSPKSGLFSTYVKIKEFAKGYQGSDFKFGYMEFISGSAAGRKSLVVGSNGYNIKLMGQFSRSYKAPNKYGLGVSPKDKVRLYRKDEFYFQLRLWHKDHISDTVPVITGKLDLSSVKTNDLERTLHISGYDTIKDLMNKNISDLNFHSGSNLLRMREVRALLLDRYFSNNLKKIQRIEEEDYPLQSVDITGVGFDVGVGWHIFDYHPDGNLFRFDLGKWHQAIDEGSFEKSTNSLFIIGNDDSTNYLNYAVLPDHSLESNTTEENAKIERKWHGGWVKFEVDVKEDVFVGSVNQDVNKSRTSEWKKFSGLPDEPQRVLFYVGEDRKITQQLQYRYRFDNGEAVVPSLLFDYIEEYLYENEAGYATEQSEAVADDTYALGMGAIYDRDDNASELWGSANRRTLRAYCFRKFFGILATFRNTDNSYTSYLTRGLSHLQIKYSNGNGFYGNINSRYVGGYVASKTSDSLFQLEIFDELFDGSFDGSFGDEYSDMVGMRLMCISGQNFLKVRKIKSATEVYGNLNRVDIETETDFPNTVSTDDRFVVINKNDNLRFIDVGSGFKDGEYPDLISRESPDLVTGDFYDIIENNYDNVEFDQVIKPEDKLHIGHRNRFNSVSIGLDINTTDSNTDYADIAWYLRRNFVMIEYYNGNEWKVARDVTVIPTSVINLKDTDSTIYDEDDVIKLKIIFDAEDWFTGSYDNADHGTWEAPSDIDENQIYCVRLSFSSGIPIYLKYTSISDTRELNLAIFWNNIKNWFQNTVDIYNGKYVVDTLQGGNLSLGMYGVELFSPNKSFTNLMQLRPIDKLPGSNGDNLFSVIDYPNIDTNYDLDIIASNENSENGISYIPVNANYHYLMEKVLKDCGYRYNNEISSKIDDYNDFGGNFVNIIGSNYDKAFPVDVGWDAAFYNKYSEDYVFESDSSYTDVCVIRDDGVYKAFAVSSDKTAVNLFTSDDGENWSDQGDIVSNLGNYLILSLDVVKNADDSKYAFYITAGNFTDGDSRYKVFVYTTTDETSLDISSMDEIIDLSTENAGPVTVLHIKGECDDSTGCRRIAWITKYDGTNVDGSNNPTDDTDLELYYSSEAAIGDAWTGSGTEILNARNPAFIVGNYAESDGNDTQNADNMHFVVLFMRSGDLYKSFGPYQSGGLTDSWSSPEEVTVSNSSTFSFSSDARISAVKDTTLYSYRKETDVDAFTMIPFRPDVNIIHIIDGVVDATTLFIDKDITKWNLVNLLSCKDECNGYDWFKTDEFSLTLQESSTYSQNDMYFGFRHKFRKILPFQNNTKFSDRIKVQYWNGVEWTDFDTIYQLNRKITNSEVCPLFGFSWDIPNNWELGELNNMVSDVYSNFLTLKAHGLYWLRVTMIDSAESDDTLVLSGFRNCYTSLFLTKGRSLFCMRDWSYVEQVYTFGNELDKNVKIDSLSYDKEDQSVIVNLVEDNPYGYNHIESYIFDVFGKCKQMMPVWDLGDQHITLKDRPKSIYRVGYENEVTTGAGSGNDPAKVMTIGGWLSSYIEGLYNDGTFSGNNFIGYNIPIPSSQIVRKFCVRGGDWELSGSHWDVDFINNVWIARAFTHVVSPTSSLGNYVLGSITNSGLLHEELVNRPEFRLMPGFYSFLERSFLGIYDYTTVINEITELPGSPVVGNYLVDKCAEVDWENGNLCNKVGQIARWDGSQWSYSLPAYGSRIYIEDTGSYKWWDGSEWRTYSITAIWPGRVTAADWEGIGLEFTLGQEGILVPYFRPFDCKPTRFFNNNVNKFYDDKVVTTFRHIPMGLESDKVFGHGDDEYEMPFNLKPTCAVEMPDLSSMKDSDGPASDQDIMEPNFPAFAFGSYMFKDVNKSADVERDDSDNDQVNPYGISSVNIFKLGGKVKNWKKALEYNGATYDDITDEMNYKDDTSTHDASQRLYFCLDEKFFAMYFQGDPDHIEYFSRSVEYYGRDGSWHDASKDTIPYGWKNPNSKWGHKTSGAMMFWDPFKSDWCRMSFQGTTGYWIRIYSAIELDFNWSVCSGYCAWDSMMWWDDYDITSTKAPDQDDGYGELTSDEKRYFDTFVPISIEYDKIRKRITGCFWNFDPSVNEYYPFSIDFDSQKLKDNSGNYYWSWEVSAIDIMDDDEDSNYEYKIQSIRNVSPVDNKCVLVDEGNNNICRIGNVKNYNSGDLLFDFDLTGAGLNTINDIMHDNGMLKIASDTDVKDGLFAHRLDRILEDSDDLISLVDDTSSLAISMENLVSYRDIVFGFSDEGNDKRIMAFQNGSSKESLSNSSFNANEIVRRFVVYKDDLYALVSTSSNGRLLKLTTINSGSADTWTELLSTSDLSQRVNELALFNSYMYIIGSTTIWRYDGSTLTSEGSITSNFDVYSAQSLGQYLYLYGELSSGGTHNVLYSYDGSSFEEIYRQDSETLDYDTDLANYKEYGKDLLVDYKGKLYFPVKNGTHNDMLSYDISTGITEVAMELGYNTDYPTAMLVYEGLVLCAMCDTSDSNSVNIKVYVPKRFEIETTLIPGDGNLVDRLERVESDPMFINDGSTLSKIPAFNTFHVIGSLSGQKDVVFKYGNRREFYCELSDVEAFSGISLKEMVDQLCTLTSCVFQVNSYNTAKIQNKDLVGRNDLYKEFNIDTDYGNTFVKSNPVFEQNPNSFRRIVLNWSNFRWDENAPISVGYTVSIDDTFDYDSLFLNDPITAHNVASNLLKQLIQVEQISAVLSLAYFLDNGENISFNIDRNFIYLNKNREYKIFGIEHNLKEMTTSILVVERELANRKEDL